MCLYNYLNYIGSCGGEINLELESNTTTIESPNYPLDYFEDINCKWYITTPPGTYARITFSHFSTESVYDTVKLYNGEPCDHDTTQLATLSGQMEDLSYTQCDSLSEHLLVDFKTDGSDSYTGFRASIETTPIRNHQSKNT